MRSLFTILVACALLLAAQLAGGVILHATTDLDDGLYRIDTSDGSYTFVGNYSLVYPSDESFIGGLAYDDDVDLFYGVSASDSARLYTIHPNDAATVDIGPLRVGFVYEGGLAFDPMTGVLYGVNAGSEASPRLFTVDTSTGAGTVVGQVAGGHHDFGGLVFDAAGQLYGLDRVTDALWKIDKVDPAGAGTYMVGTGLGSGVIMGAVGGMAQDANGVVYGYADGSDHLFTVDLTTGLATIIHSYTASDPTFYCLGFSRLVSPVEPMSWGRIKAIYAR